MTERPGGTVTFLFTDLVGSTTLLDRLGDDQYEQLRRTHFRLLRKAMAATSGHEVKTMGDGVMAVFSGAVDAVGCAVAMQQAVFRHNEEQPEDQRLHVRIGLHVGDPIRDEEDYFGKPPVIARRLCDSAEGGQILASELVRALVGARGGHAYRALGPLSLKGLAEPVAACEVAWQPAVERDAARPPLPAPLDRATWIRFVGRERELDRLGDAWELARAGRRSLLALTGDDGIGKTRLAAEFARRQHDRGAAVLYARCHERPLDDREPLLQALGSYVSACPANRLQALARAGDEELGRLISELTGRLPESTTARPPTAGGDAQQVFAGVSGLIAAICGDSPCLLVLDDLHWAAKETLLLLRRLLLAPEPLPMLVLVTCREPDLRSGMLPDVLADLRRDHVVERLTLGRLDEAEVRALISSWAAQEASRSLVSVVHQQTEGNPFFIIELLRDLADLGALNQRDGRLSTDLAEDQIAVPESVREVMRVRLSALSGQCARLLAVAAVLGREFDLETLERASGSTHTEALELMEEAVRVQVLSEIPGAAGRYGFRQRLLRESLYSDHTEARRLHLHQQSLRYAESGEVKLAYEVLGSTGPYLMAVGLTNCPAVAFRQRNVAAAWERMSRRCRVALYDRRGVGSSDAPERGYSLTGSVEDIRAVLDAAGADQAVVWGASDGGPLAITFAAQYPERVAGLVLVGTTPKLVSSSDFAFGINPQALEPFLRIDALDRERAASQLAGTRHDPDEARAIAEVLRRVPQPVWSKILGAFAAADARSVLGRVGVPTLIVHDPDNTYIPVEAANLLHDQITASRLLITEGSAGALFAEEVYQAIEAFIEDVMGGSSRR